MSAEILGTNCYQCLSMVQCCFTSTETVRLIRTKKPRAATSTFTQILNSAMQGSTLPQLYEHVPTFGVNGH